MNSCNIPQFVAVASLVALIYLGWNYLSPQIPQTTTRQTADTRAIESSNRARRDMSANRNAAESKQLDTPLLRKARELVAEDPRTALKWIIQLPDDSRYNAVLDDPAVQKGLRDGADALIKTALSEKSGKTIGAVEDMLSLWSTADPATAYQWVQAQSSGVLRDRLMQNVAFAEARTDPEEAAKLVVRQIPPGIVQTQATISVLHQWALRDKESAMAWAKIFPVGELRTRALDAVEETTDSREQ